MYQPHERKPWNHHPPEFIPVTLSQVWTDFQITRKLASSTVHTYEARLTNAFRDWLGKPITAISKDMVELRHRDLTLNRGPMAANLACKVLKILLNYAIGKYETSDCEPILKRNPVKRLSDIRAWNPEHHRENYLDAPELRQWFQAIIQIKNLTAVHYLLFLALTGCRRSEAGRLRWEDVDFEKRQTTFRSTKNHRDHVLPIHPYLMEVLERRRAQTPLDQFYVFTGWTDSPYEMPHRLVRKIRHLSNANFSCHGMRRTYATTAEDLKIQRTTIKQLLNHVLTDVTEKYIIYSAERYRAEAELIASTILGHCFGTDNPSIILAIEKKPILLLPMLRTPAPKADLPEFFAKPTQVTPLGPVNDKRRLAREALAEKIERLKETLDPVNIIKVHTEPLHGPKGDKRNTKSTC